MLWQSKPEAWLSQWRFSNVLEWRKTTTGPLRVSMPPQRAAAFPGGGKPLAGLSPRVAEGGTAGPGETSRGPAHPGPSSAPGPARSLQRAAAAGRGPGPPGAAGRWAVSRPAAAFPGGRRLLPEEQEGPRARRCPEKRRAAAAPERETLLRASGLLCPPLESPAGSWGSHPGLIPRQPSWPRGMASKRGRDGGVGGGGAPLCPPGATSPAGAGGLGPRCEGNGCPPLACRGGLRPRRALAWCNGRCCFKINFLAGVGSQANIFISFQPKPVGDWFILKENQSLA